MPEPLVLTPTDFVAITNQVLEVSFGHFYLEGEISGFRISKQKWLYFDLKDENSKVSCFGSVYNMPGPLENGVRVRVGGSARMHPQFGFNVTVQSIRPVGEGSIHQALALLKDKLTKEGLFSADRKRYLPDIPKKIALVASVESAAYADFVKIVGQRWPMVSIEVYDTLVQGENAPGALVEAIKRANSQPELADVLVVTRGGGSADDLAAFNDERVVRAIVASRLPTMVAIGHEVDESFSELVSDKRASTPSNAAELLVPSRVDELSYVVAQKKHLSQLALGAVATARQSFALMQLSLQSAVKANVSYELHSILQTKQLLKSYNPHNVLARGYAIIESSGKPVQTAIAAKAHNKLDIRFKDGVVGVTRR